MSFWLSVSQLPGFVQWTRVFFCLPMLLHNHTSNKLRKVHPVRHRVVELRSSLEPETAREPEVPLYSLGQGICCDVKLKFTVACAC